MTEHNNESVSQQIIDNASDAIVFADRDGVVRVWNTGAERIFGFRADEMVGKSMDVIIPENMRERHWEGFENAMKTGRTQYTRDLLAVPAVRKDGSRISIEFTIAMIRDADGILLGPAAILRDVTARWKQDKELRRRLEALENQVKKLNAQSAS